MTVIEPFPLDYSRKISYFTMVIGISSNSTPPIKAMAPKRVGIAGYMGSGKSTAARFLARDPGSVIDADREAKSLMQESPLIRSLLAEAFGARVIERGKIRFDLLGAAAFNSEAALTRLNKSFIRRLVKILKERLSERNGRPVILDAALLPLWRIESLFDACLWMHAPVEMRLRRILAGRPDLDEAAVRGRMRLQELVLPEPAPGFSWLHIGNSENRERLSEALIGFQCGGL